MELPPATMADARRWLEESMMRFGGHEVDESLYYHLQAGWRLDVSAVAELSTRDSDMYLKVLEYCFTTYPETRGRIGALMRVGPELMPRVFEVFEMACASQPRAAVAAYLSGALGSKDEENAPAALSTAFRMDSLSEKDENFMTLLTHPLMDPTVGDSQLLTQRHQDYDDKRRMELRETVASSSASDCWWSSLPELHSRPMREGLASMLLDQETRQQQDLCCPMVGLRLLLSKRPELLFPSHLRPYKYERVTVFEDLCRQELLLPFLDILEEVYGQLFTFQYLNQALRRAWKRLVLRSGGRAFLSSVFCHPLADLSMISVEAYLDRPWTQEDVLEDVSTRHLRLRPNSDIAITLGQSLEQARRAQVERMERLYPQCMELCAADTKVAMRRGRFFILGEGRVGKSSILRALMGEDFDPALESTEVFDLKAFEMGFVDKEDLVPIKDPSKIAGSTGRQARALLVAQMREKQAPYAVMDSHQDEQPKPSSDSPPSSVVQPSAALAPASSGPTESHEPLSPSTPEPINLPSETMSSASLLDDEASRHVRLVAHKPAKAIDGAATLVALDFAGQHMYRVLHHVFISEAGASIFAIVFNLSEAYTATQQDQQKQDEYLATILFWYRSIQTYASSEIGVTAFMIGTHADELATAVGSESWREPFNDKMWQALLKIDSMLRRAIIQGAEWDTTFNLDVGVTAGVTTKQMDKLELGFFPWGPDEDVVGIRHAIVASVKEAFALADEYPASWIAALEDLQKSGKDVMRVADIMDILQPLHASFSDLSIVRAMLQQFHRVGEVIYFDQLTPSPVDNIVVLRPMWLVDTFRPIMNRTVVPTAAELTVPPSLASRKPGPVSQEAWTAQWHLFLREGLLSHDLLEHSLWTSVDPTIMDVTLLLLERLDLVMPLRSAGNNTRGGYMLVPCVPMHHWQPGQGVQSLDDSQVVMVLGCKEATLLPGGFFSRLLLEGVRHKVWGPPMLRRHYAEVCPTDLQPLKLWMREEDHSITIGTPRSHLHQSQNARAAALICQLAWRLCELKYASFASSLNIKVARADGSLVEVETVLSELAPLSVRRLREFAEQDEVLAAFVSQLCAPIRPQATGAADTLQLVTTDFFLDKTLVSKGCCSESIELVRCPKLTDMGWGELFVKKNITHDCSETYEREITLHRQLRNDAFSWNAPLCRIITHFPGVFPKGKTGTQDGMCIIYEYCAGGDLTTFLEELQAKTRTLSVELCHAFALRLLVAVDYVHRVCQRLHLDIKPDNILLSEARDQLYVADLGISQVISGTEAQTVQPAFSPQQAFEPPEAWATQPIACMASDRWAAGIVILQLIRQQTLASILSGLPPAHPARSAKKAANLQANDIKALLEAPPALDVGSELKDLVVDLLASDWKKRPSDEQALVRVKAANATLTAAAATTPTTSGGSS